MGKHGKYRSLVIRRPQIWVAVVWLALLPGLVSAQSICRLALLLALDVSSSVDDAEYALQKHGLADALLDEDIQTALLGQGGTVSLAVYEWSGRRQSVVIQNWITLRDRQTIKDAAARIRGTTRSYSRFPTALGFALGFGATMMRQAPDCERQVIDVSGDGITNDGFWPYQAYEHFPFSDITVNGLAVLGADPDVLDHYLFEVQRGPGAFVETADGYEGYRRAMTRKLFREVNNQVIGRAPIAAGTGSPG